MELMEAGLKLEAIMVLQKELMPRVSKETPQATEADKLKLHALAQLIMCS